MRSKAAFPCLSLGAFSLAIALSVSACTTVSKPSDTAASPTASPIAASPIAANPAPASPAELASPGVAKSLLPAAQAQTQAQTAHAQTHAQSSPAPTQSTHAQTLYELNPDQTAPTSNDTLQTLNAIATKAGKCVTVIDDSAPPSNVRSAPVMQSGNVVGKLDNFSVVEVVNNQNNWLEIQSPMHGWVSLDLTRAVCGTEFRPVLQRINALNQKALGGDRASTDLLIRYAVQSADGAGADAAYGSLGQLAQQHPNRLIAALDAQPEAGRRKLLEGLDLLSLNPKGRRSFEKALARQSETPTAKSWQTVKRK